MAGKQKKYEFKFKTWPPILQYTVVNLRGVQRNWEKPRESLLQSPKSLMELAADVVDSEPLPEAMFWDMEKVGEWIENTVKLPQYKVCFTKNFIRGRHLILLGPNHLVRMSIEQFDHIKRIMNEIRVLYCVPLPTFARDLTLPSIYGTVYEWNLLYYRHVARQSPSNATPRTVYWYNLRLLLRTSLPQYSCHWQTIGVDKEEEKIRIGRYRRKHQKSYWTPMFREGSFVPTQQKLDYFFIDPLYY